jgi:hypothetical protein
MKIKSNIRAGKGGDSGNGGNSSSSKDSKINNTVVSYVAAISRCVGL